MYTQQLPFDIVTLIVGVKCCKSRQIVNAFWQLQKRETYAMVTPSRKAVPEEPRNAICVKRSGT